MEEIDLLIKNIESNISIYNKNVEYALSLSIGYSVFREADTVDSFLAAADKEMYRCKQNSKLSEQRPI